MIIKKMRGNGFRGVLSYVLGNKVGGQPNRAEIIGGNMGGQTAAELAREFGQLRQLKPQSKNPVRHFAIRLHPEDRNLSVAELFQLGTSFCEQFGYGNTYQVFLLHRDSTPPHLHIVTSQIGFDGKLNREYKDIYRIKRFCRACEVEMHLTPVASGRNGNGKLYHPRRRGTCLIDRAERQQQFDTLSNIRSAPTDRAVLDSMAKSIDNPLLVKARAFNAEVVAAAMQRGGRLLECVQLEGNLLGQISRVKASLLKAKGTAQERMLLAQLAVLEMQLAQNLADRIAAWNLEAEQEHAEKERHKRRFRI